MALKSHIPSVRRLDVARGLLTEVSSFLRNAEDEVGGVLIGRRESPDRVEVAVALFPPQTYANSYTCAFDSTLMTSICDVLDDVMSESDGQNIQPVGWIHTHPGLGAFFSAIDHRTFDQWAALDPMAVAIVVDPRYRSHCRRPSRHERFFINAQGRAPKVSETPEVGLPKGATLRLENGLNVDQSAPNDQMWAVITSKGALGRRPPSLRSEAVGTNATIFSNILASAWALKAVRHSDWFALSWHDPDQPSPCFALLIPDIRSRSRDSITGLRRLTEALSKSSGFPCGIRAMVRESSNAGRETLPGNTDIALWKRQRGSDGWKILDEHEKPVGELVGGFEAYADCQILRSSMDDLWPSFSRIGQSIILIDVQGIKKIPQG